MKTYPGILSGAVVFISGKVKPAAAQDMLICTDGARKKSNWNIPPLAGLTYRWEEEIAPAQPGWGEKKKKFLQKVLPTCEYLETRKSGSSQKFTGLVWKFIFRPSHTATQPAL